MELSLAGLKLLCQTALLCCLMAPGNQGKTLLVKKIASDMHPARYLTLDDARGAGSRQNLILQSSLPDWMGISS